MDSFGPGPGTCRVCLVCVVCVVWCLWCVGASGCRGCRVREARATQTMGPWRELWSEGRSRTEHRWNVLAFPSPSTSGDKRTAVVQARHVLRPVHRTGPHGMYMHQTETERWQPGQGKGIAIALLPLRRARRPLRNAMSAEVEALLTSPGPAAGPTPRLRAAEISRVGVLLEFAAV